MTCASFVSRCPTALALCLLAGVIAGCGFQLRGAAPVSSALQPLAVQCADQVPAELCNAVTEQLELGEVTLVSRDKAAYLLRLTSFNQQRRASAITLQAAAAEYDLRQTVTMDVITADQVPLVTEVDIRSSETYRYDETNVLAKQREERDIQETLYQRLAQQVIFRLAPLTRERIEVLRQQATEQADDNAS